MIDRDVSPDSRTPFPSREPEGTSFGAWTLVWTLYVVKLATVVYIFLAARSFETAALLTVTTWLWLGPAVILAAAPIAFQIRLRRVRARRAALMASEWMTGGHNSPVPEAMRE